MNTNKLKTEFLKIKAKVLRIEIEFRITINNQFKEKHKSNP